MPSSSNSFLDRLVVNNAPLVSLISVLLLLSLLSCSPHTAAQTAANSPLVELIPITLDSRDPQKKEFGRLTFLNGFQLRSRDPRFGGLSGLTIADGKLYSVSDRGYWISAQMNFDGDGRLTDLTDWNIQPILSTNGTPVAGALYDAEALTRALDGSLLVAFEGLHRICYAPRPATFDSLPLPVPVPPELVNAPSNGGLESITVLPDDRILAITEEFANPDGSFKGWLLKNGQFAELSYLPSYGFQASDCAALKNGDVIVIERRYVPLGILYERLKLVKARDIRPGAKLVGEELLRLEYPLEIDNFEGVAVQEDPIKGTTIYLVSDDNYNPFQRTLLLQFRLATPANRTPLGSKPRGSKPSTKSRLPPHFDRGRKRLSPSPPSEPCVRFSRTRLSSWWFPHRDWLASSRAATMVNSPWVAKNLFGQR